MALAAAIASTRTEEHGNWTYSDKDASTCPWLSRIITPKPALLMSLKSAPSKLILSEFSGGGIQVTQPVLGAETGAWCTQFSRWKTESICRAFGMTWAIGNALCCTLIWFLRVQIVHINTTINSTFFFLFVTEEYQLLNVSERVVRAKGELQNGIPDRCKGWAFPYSM